MLEKSEGTHGETGRKCPVQSAVSEQPTVLAPTWLKWLQIHRKLQFMKVKLDEVITH